MTGSHEVRGSSPLSSTREIKGLAECRLTPFFVEMRFVQPWYNFFAGYYRFRRHFTGIETVRTAIESGPFP